MSSINVDLDYFSHRKVMRLIGLVGPEYVFVPIKLWCYVGKYHCEDGVLSGYQPEELESILGWNGEKGALLAALTTVGFLDRIVIEERSIYQVHDWLEHAGHLFALKKRARANAEKRWGRIAINDATSTQLSTPHSNATSMLPLNPLNLLSPLNPLRAGASSAPEQKSSTTLPKSFKKLETVKTEHEPMPEVVRSILEQAGRGKGMPP